MEVLPKQTSVEFIALHKYRFIFTGIAFVLVVIIAVLMAPTKARYFTVPQNSSFQKACSEQVLHYVHCTIVRVLTGGDIRAGSYKVSKIVFTPWLAYRLTEGISNEKQIKITFPEGNTYTEMRAIMSENFSTSNDADTIAGLEAEDFMGYYFPTTYFFSENSSLDAILSRMKVEADNVHASLQNEYALAQNTIIKKYSWNDIVIMASILEKEALKNDAHMIAGILWKRLENGWPLQVDADPSTYQNKGLSVRPIANPGEFMLRAALEPTDSTYWYYLHDKMGGIHFGKTLDEHNANKAKYLR